MARKKVTPPPSAAVVTDSTKFQNTDNFRPSHRPESPTDDRMENLKTLNGLLVKETMDAREQLDQLKSQIDDVSLESSFISDIDRAVSRLVVEAAFKEAQQKLVGLDRRLGSFVAETEECKLEAWEEIRKVKVEVESLMREKEENERCLVEVNREVARLMREKDEVERDLAVVVGEKDERGRDCGVLRSEVNMLKENILHLEDAINRSNVELEKEKRESASKVDLLVTENKLVVENLKKELNIVIGEKDKLEILAAQLSEKLQSSEESCRVFGDEKRKLLSDIRELKDEIAESHKESNNFRKEVDNLKNRVLELEEGIERSESQLEDEKRKNERKMEMLIMENNLVISNLKEELNDFVNEKVELKKTMAEVSEKLQSSEESCRVFGDEKRKLLSDVRKLKDEIAESHKESNNFRKEVDNLKNHVLELEEGIERSESQLEVEKRTNERKMEMLIMENNLVISKLKEELNDFVSEKVELEKTMAEVSEKLQSFQECCGLLGEEKKHLLSTVNELKDEIDMLKREETAKSLTISELQKMNDKYTEKINKLHGELDAKTEEGLEKENEFKLRAQDMSRQMDDLQRILEAVVEEKGGFELMNHKQESEIDNLVKEVELLKSEVSRLSKSCNVQAENIKRLQGEKTDLQKMVNQQIEKEKDLELQVVSLQNCKATADKELEHLKTASDKVVEEKKTLENKLQCVVEEKKVACGVLASTKENLEVSKKVAIAAAELSELSLAALKGMAEELNLGEHDTSASGLGEDKVKSELLADERIKPFLVELESIKKFFWIRKKEMESMKHELLLLQESIAGAKKRGLWAWVSSATTIVAAVAYAVKNR